MSFLYAQQANYVAVPLKQIDTIITDDELSEAGKDLINEAGITDDELSEAGKDLINEAGIELIIV